LTEGDKKHFPKKGRVVKIDYLGRIQSTGEKFDRSKDPFEFEVGKGQVIKGLDEGIITMSLGEKAKFTFPPELAYGDKGHGKKISPNSTLVFEVKLRRIGTSSSLDKSLGLL